MWRTDEGSTGRLLQFCAAYFVLYVITGVTVKWFLGNGMHGIQILVYSTAGGSLLVFPVVVGLRWYRLASNGAVAIAGVRVPRELGIIVPSGVCTAVVIATTTLMYTLPITVMVAMTMMRGSVIVIGRVVDAIQVRQGILHKRVYAEENLAIGLALAAVGVHMAGGATHGGGFDFLSDPTALVVFCSYIGSYAIRIYLMNYFKNTRAPGVRLDNKGFFALEQFAATGTLIAIAVVVLAAGGDGPRVELFRGAIVDPVHNWGWATVAGMAFGAAAFFSVFLFMFKGRTATFAGLVNRLTSLVAGTTATVIFWLGLGGKAIDRKDWIAVGFILVAVAVLARAERKRAAELRSREPAR